MIARASAEDLPVSSSVSTELEAIAATQPCVLKRAARFALFHTNGKPQHVSADRISHLYDCRRVRKVAGVVWVSKMVENRIVEHHLGPKYV